MIFQDKTSDTSIVFVTSLKRPWRVQTLASGLRHVRPFSNHTGTHRVWYRGIRSTRGKKTKKKRDTGQQATKIFITAVLRHVSNWKTLTIFLYQKNGWLCSSRRIISGYADTCFWQWDKKLTNFGRIIEWERFEYRLQCLHLKGIYLWVLPPKTKGQKPEAMNPCNIFSIWDVLSLSLSSLWHMYIYI